MSIQMKGWTKNCSSVSMKRARQGIEIRAETNTVPDCTLPLQLQLPTLGWYNGPEPASIEQPLHFTSAASCNVMEITISLCATQVL